MRSSSWRLLRLVLIAGNAVAVGLRLLYPDWQVTTPHGESSTTAWLLAPPEQPFGRAFIDWVGTLVQVAAMAVCLLLTWIVLTHDLRRAERRERESTMPAASDG